MIRYHAALAIATTFAVSDEAIGKQCSILAEENGSRPWTSRDVKSYSRARRMNAAAKDDIKAMRFGTNLQSAYGEQEKWCGACSGFGIAVSRGLV